MASKRITDCLLKLLGRSLLLCLILGTAWRCESLRKRETRKKNKNDAYDVELFHNVAASLERTLDQSCYPHVLAADVPDTRIHVSAIFCFL
jgi:hypothetical protein